MRDNGKIKSWVINLKSFLKLYLIGLNVIVGLRENGESWKTAVQDGWVPGMMLSFQILFLFLQC